jgi:Protein of unknown function (DUF1236)
MMSLLKTTAAAVILLAGIGSAAAQAVIELSPEQRTTVYQTIVKERVRTPPPPDWRVGVGIEVPTAVELYDVPPSVTVAPVRRYRYTVVNDQVVLVDPTTRRVIQIIGE